MRWLRWVIGIVVVLLVLFVGVVVFLVNFINPNDYRNQINELISKKIHKPFSIQGDIGWIFFPEIGFKVNDMTVGDKANTKDIYAKLKYLEINLKLLPLLHKTIALDALRLDGADVTLPASTASDENKPKDTAAPDSGASSPASSAGALAAIPDLSLGELSVKDVNVTQLGDGAKPAWQVKNLTLSASDVGDDESTPLMLDFDYLNPAKNMNANIKFASTLNVELSDQKLSAKSTKLSVSTAPNSTPAIDLALSVDKVYADLKDHQVDVKGIDGTLNKMDFSGDASVKNFDTAPTGNANWNMSTDNLATVAHSFGVNLPAIPELNGKFSFNTKAQYGDNQLTMDPLTIQLGSSTIQGQVKSTDLKNMALSLALQSAGLNAQGAGLSGLKVNLSVLPPAGPNKDWIASAVNGSVSVQSLTYQKQKIQNVQVNLDGKDKIFKLSKLHANAFAGSVDATGLVNMQNKAPSFSISPNVQNVQVGDLLQLVEPKLKMTGIANLSGSINSAGTEPTVIKHNLNGNLKINVKKGVLYGLDAAYWINAATQAYHGHFGDMSDTLSKKEGNSTPFGNVSASLLIKQGVVNNPDFLLTGPIAQVKGSGTFDLNRETINYRAQITKTGSSGKQHNDVVPVIIGGTFDQPSFSLDKEAIAKAIVVNQSNEIVKKVMGKDVADSPLGQQVSDTIGQLFGS